MEPAFSSALAGRLSDPARSYAIPRFIDFTTFSQLVIFDSSGLLTLPVAGGRIVQGPPPTLPGGEGEGEGEGEGG
jgi:hypothetical protein